MMAIRKHGSNLDINGLVIHQLRKIAGDRNVKLKTATRVLPIKEKEKVFLGRLNESYRKKSNPTYGIFAGSNPSFKNLLEQYLMAGDFYEFSV